MTEQKLYTPDNRAEDGQIEPPECEEHHQYMEYCADDNEWSCEKCNK